jgi:two-component system response regulator WspF
MNIAIVNDVSMICTLLTRIIHEHSPHQVIWTAENGAIAIDKAQQETPDLILMDLIMPVMDGITATREIMKNTPCAIVVVTANMDQNADMVFSAMAHGALDAISTPTLAASALEEGMAPLLHKLSVINSLISTSKPRPHPIQKPAAQSSHQTGSHPLICIGASTGGPGAVATILADMPDNIPASIVIVQHVDEHFTAGLAEWLDGQCKPAVSVARQGEKAEIGKIYVAGGNRHLRLNPQLGFEYTADPVDYPYRPSIDIFFHSVNRYWTGPKTGVLLTGMGSDGAQGLLTLKNNNNPTIAQDENSCAVYGMPRAAAKLDAAAMILPIEDISSALLKILSRQQTSTRGQAQSR